MNIDRISSPFRISTSVIKDCLIRTMGSRKQMERSKRIHNTILVSLFGMFGMFGCDPEQNLDPLSDGQSIEDTDQDASEFRWVDLKEHQRRMRCDNQCWAEFESCRGDAPGSMQCIDEYEYCADRCYHALPGNSGGGGAGGGGGGYPNCKSDACGTGDYEQ